MMLVVRMTLAVMLICVPCTPGLTSQRHDTHGRLERPNRSNRLDRSERPDRSDRPDTPGKSDRPDRPKRHSHTFTVGVNDDTLLNVAAKRRREKKLGVAPDIPALTDTTFPATVYNTNSSLVVVLFYLPFDPVGTLFLQQYQQAGRQLVALKGGNSSSCHPLVRVNCHDWTDVCRKENITTYPVIHLYQQGKWRQRYRDALDKDVLVRTVFLLQCGQPLWLRTEEEVRQFLDGHLPHNAHRLVDNLVILKSSVSLTEVAAFTEVARELETQMLFAIVSPDVNTPLIRIEVGVVHVRRDDQYQPYDTLTRSLDTQTIRHFLVTGKFQFLPELTFLNFPELSSRHHPLGVLFVRPTDTETALHRRAVVDVIRSGRVHNVTFCSMAVDDDNPMADTLLRTYTGYRPVPSFVIVDLRKRTVFTFTKWELTDTKLILWILGVQAGKIPPTSHLPRGQWRPASRHIDFLAKMDRDRERKEKTDSSHTINSQDEEHSSHSEKIGRFPLHATGDEDHENPNQYHQNLHSQKHHKVQLGIHHHQNQDHHRGNQNQHERNQVRNQNQNNHDRNEHEENDVRPQQKQNQHERSQNQHDDQNEIGHDYSWKQDELNQNQLRNQDQDKHHLKMNPNKLNQNQPHPNQNQHDPNQKRHRRNQNENQKNLNENEHRPNQHSRHEAPKLKQTTKTRLNVHDGQLNSDRGHKKRPRESLPARKDSSSDRTSSRDTGSLEPDKDKDGEGRLLHTEL